MIVWAPIPADHDPLKPARLLTREERIVRRGTYDRDGARSEYERGLVERFTAGLTLSIADKKQARRLIREGVSA